MNYLELTLHNFLDVITDTENIHDIQIKSYPNNSNEEIIIRGTFDQIMEAIHTTETTQEFKDQVSNYISELRKKTYNEELSELEIYNYLETTTSCFNAEKTRIILKDIKVYYDMEFIERINTESYNTHIMNQWELPGELINDKLIGNHFCIDYKKMRGKTHPFASWSIDKAIELLTRKLQEQNDSIKNKLPKEIPTFNSLFKYPHNQDLVQFKKKLQECKLIDDSYQWREVDNNGKKTPSKDIGMFYNWLYSETTVFNKTADKTNECICFCKEFGILAYKEGEKPTLGRIATIKLITGAECDNESRTKYNTYFKTWLNKEK
jgi:hypothetical protein